MNLFNLLTELVVTKIADELDVNFTGRQTHPLRFAFESLQQLCYRIFCTEFFQKSSQ